MQGNQHHPNFNKLLDFLKLVPGIQTNSTPWGGFGTGMEKDGWWVKFSIDLHNGLAWNVVQEFAHVLNGLSLTEVLPTVFKPVSPSPYLNGGPSEFLSWVIECNDPNLRPGTIADWLVGRLPQPIDDVSAWSIED